MQGDSYNRIFDDLKQRQKKDFLPMKKGIHPDYEEITVVLSDGTEFKTRSTMNPDGDTYRSEVDSKNHPFYTDNLKLQKKADRIDRFNKRYGKEDN